MKITKVSYQKTYSIGPYLTDKIGFEAEISEPSLDNLMIETSHDVLYQLSQLADEWHRQAHPNLYPHQVSNPSVRDSNYSPPTVTTTNGNEPMVINLSTERIEIAIDNASTTDELKKIKEDNPVMPFLLMKEYNKRFEELTELESKSFTNGLT